MFGNLHWKHLKIPDSEVFCDILKRSFSLCPWIVKLGHIVSQCHVRFLCEGTAGREQSLDRAELYSLSCPRSDEGRCDEGLCSLTVSWEVWQSMRQFLSHHSTSSVICVWQDSCMGELLRTKSIQVVQYLSGLKCLLSSWMFLNFSVSEQLLKVGAHYSGMKENVFVSVGFWSPTATQKLYDMKIKLYFLWTLTVRQMDFISYQTSITV